MKTENDYLSPSYLAMRERMAAELGLAAREVAENYNFGRAGARKTGRDPRWPYVPVIWRDWRSEQIRSFAFETSDEAKSFAQFTIDARRKHLAEQLVEPRFRALRVSHGMPEMLAEGTP